MCNADDGLKAQAFETVLHAGPSTFRGQALSPEPPGKQIANLGFFRFWQILQPIPTDQGAVLPKLGCPPSIPVLFPLLELMSDQPLDAVARRRVRGGVIAQDVSHGEDTMKRVDVGCGKGAQIPASIQSVS